MNHPTLEGRTIGVEVSRDRKTVLIDIADEDGSCIAWATLAQAEAFARDILDQVKEAKGKQ